MESEIQLKESGIPLTIGIRNPSFTEKDLESITWNPESTAGNSESKTVLDSLTLRRLKSQQKASHDQSRALKNLSMEHKQEDATLCVIVTLL